MTGILRKIIEAIRVALHGRPMTKAEVEAALSALAKEPGKQGLNWRESVVDLMKLLDLDSSLEARKELADQLDYPGHRDGSAEFNMNLHAALMQEVANRCIPVDKKD